MALNASSWIECPEHFGSSPSCLLRLPRAPPIYIYDSLTLMTDVFYPPLFAYLTFFPLLCLLLFANKYHPKKPVSLSFSFLYVIRISPSIKRMQPPTEKEARLYSRLSPVHPPSCQSIEVISISMLFSFALFSFPLSLAGTQT